MTRDPWQPLGTALADTLIAVLETAARAATIPGRIAAAADRWAARAATNPADPDESDAEAASPVGDYRSRA